MKDDGVSDHLGAGSSLCVVRRGHIGDVLLTEPVATALKARFEYLALCTEHREAGELLEVYSAILPYRQFERGELSGFSATLELVYEVYPGCNHLDGYAQCASVALPYRLPRVKRGADRLLQYPYGLVAPFTSEFVKRMRQWPLDRFRELAAQLERILGLPFVLLDSRYSFKEMVSLCENASCFIGNDSGPAILSQCFRRPTFVIFGATDPGRVLLSPEATPIVHTVGCNGCKHFARHTDIECNSPVCLDGLSVESALRVVLAALKTERPLS